MSASLTRTETFLQIAEVFAKRSTCIRGHVGAVIVQDRHIVAHGYNGAPPGQPECFEVGCQLNNCNCDGMGEFSVSEGEGMVVAHREWCPRAKGCQRAIHAEENAILYAARVGVSCKGATMYSTYEPCRQCARMIATTGILSVSWLKPYRLGAASYLFELGVQVQHFGFYRKTPITMEQP